MGLKELLAEKYPHISERKRLRRFGRVFLENTFLGCFSNNFSIPRYTKGQIMKKIQKKLNLESNEAEEIFDEVINTEYPLNTKYSTGRRFGKSNNVYDFNFGKTCGPY